MNKVKTNKKSINKSQKSFIREILRDRVFMGMIFGVVIMFIAIFLIYPNGRMRIDNIVLIEQLENVFKIMIATIIGGIIGIERGNKNRPAGLRTHALVSVGACVVMIISFSLFDKYHHLANFDPARLGAQVISGIGFLGAGTIIRNGVNVKGLTTAASLWVVACIGLSVGAGMYLVSVSSTIIVYFTLHVLGNFERRHLMKNSNMILNIFTKDKAGQFGKIGNVLGSFNVRIGNMQIERDEEDEGYENNELMVVLTLKVPFGTNTNAMISEIEEIEDIIEVEIPD